MLTAGKKDVDARDKRSTSAGMTAERVIDDIGTR
jgi:hypothetical protein